MVGAAGRKRSRLRSNNYIFNIMLRAFCRVNYDIRNPVRIRLSLTPPGISGRPVTHRASQHLTGCAMYVTGH